MTRVSTLWTVVALALVVGVTFLMDGRGRPGPIGDVTDTIKLHATFAPPNRGTRPVVVLVDVEGVRTIDDRLVHSGWRPEFPVPKGAPVRMTLSQETSGKLTCRVDRNGRKGTPMSRETSGEIICTG